MEDAGEDYKEAQRSFWELNIHCFDCGDDFMSVYAYQNLSNCVL